LIVFPLEGKCAQCRSFDYFAIRLVLNATRFSCTLPQLKFLSHTIEILPSTFLKKLSTFLQLAFFLQQEFIATGEARGS